MRRSSLVLLLIVVAALEMRGRAWGDDRRGLSLTLAAGYGLQDDSDAGQYGAALGVRVGYALPYRLHVGVEGTFHLGTQSNYGLDRVHYYGPELGVRCGGERVAVIPYFTSGVAVVSSERNIRPTIVTGYAGTGVTVTVPLDRFVVGVDLRAILIPFGIQQGDNDGPSGTIELLLTGGIRL